jgi:hypothetical protein
MAVAAWQNLPADWDMHRPPCHLVSFVGSLSHALPPHLSLVVVHACVCRGSSSGKKRGYLSGLCQHLVRCLMLSIPCIKEGTEEGPTVEFILVGSKQGTADVVTIVSVIQYCNEEGVALRDC